MSQDNAFCSCQCKNRTRFVQVTHLLICLGPLEGMLYLPLLPAHSSEPIAEYNTINDLRMNIWLIKEVNFREGNNTLELVSLIQRHEDEIDFQEEYLANQD